LDAVYHVASDEVDTTNLWTEVIHLLESGQLDEAAAELPIVGTGTQAIPPPGEPWPQLEAAGALLVQFEEALDKMHAAGRVENGSARFSLKWEDGFGMGLPHAQQMRGAARLLSLEARVHAHRRNTDGVVESLKSLLAAGHALEHEPIFVSQLVRMAITGMAISDLVELLPHGDFTEDQLVELSRRLARYEQSPGLTTALRGERVLGMDAIRHPGKAGSDMPRVAFTNDNLVFYLELLNQAVDASKRPFPEALDDAAKLRGVLRDKIGRGGLQKVRYAAAAMLAPSLDAAFGSAARDTASVRMAQTLIAAERFRRREGRFPGNVNELVPAFLSSVPLDPGDGQPLRLASSESECKIYSVGRNRIDDGGQGAENLDDVMVLIRRNAQ
jgi:hypothetical protein